MKRSGYRTWKALELCSDECLVSSAKRGEHSAFAELSERSTPMLICVLTRITKNKEDAEDALQEALMKAFTHLSTFDGRSSFSTWLTVIAKNTAFMTLRKRRKVPDISLDANLENENTTRMQYADLAPNPEYVCLQNERRRHLRDAIQRLSPVLRKCIEMRYAKGGSVRELAADTGISIPATKARLSRAQRILTNDLSRTTRKLIRPSNAAS